MLHHQRLRWRTTSSMSAADSRRAIRGWRSMAAPATTRSRAALGNNVLIGGDDNDKILTGGNGNDQLLGGNGNDQPDRWRRQRRARSAVPATMSSTAAPATTYVIGGQGDDTITGGTGSDIVHVPERPRRP